MKLQRDHEGVAVNTMEASLADVLFVKLLIKVAAFRAEFGGDVDELRVRQHPAVRAFEGTVVLGVAQRPHPLQAVAAVIYVPPSDPRADLTIMSVARVCARRSRRGIIPSPSESVGRCHVCSILKAPSALTN